VRSLRRKSLLFLAAASSMILSGAWGPARADEVAAEALPEGVKLVAVEVHPQAVRLTNRFDYAQLLLSATLESGDVIDVTRLAQIEPSELVEVSRRGLVRPRRDGSGELRLALPGHELSISLEVAGSAEPFTASFVGDVQPVLSRIGCNSGTCHGSQQGRNGFKLSLRGNEPEFDYLALTDDLAGRRFNRSAPDQSLFLLKISGAVPHEGGLLTRPSAPYYEILRSWVAAGVKLDLDSPRVVRIEIFPKERVIPMPGGRQQTAVIATYSDSRVRDVSAEAFIESSNTEVLAAGSDGIVTALRRGEAAILARYEGNYSATQFFVMGDRGGFEWQEVPEHNYIDTLVYQKLKKIKTQPSELATDAEFLRRVYLDLTGLPPAVKETRAFLLDRRDTRQKRDELVDRLIGSAEFIEHWTSKWCDLLQVNGKYLGPQGVAAMSNWIRQAVASNMPYDRFAHAILDSSGSTLENPPAAYYKVLREPDLLMENTTQLFLGVRFNCNKCHDHPFERWTQGDHWQLAAFFAQVGRKNAPGSPIMPTSAENQLDGQRPAFEEIIYDLDSGEVTAPYSGKTVAPAFPYEHPGGAPENATRRARLAGWLAAPENPYFARSYVNRIWSYFLGAGLIDPVDDIRASNPPSNPELLDRLTAEFIESGFDVRRLMRTICKSRVYQHSYRTNRWNEDDGINFSHALARRLSAETLFDAIHMATGSVSKLPGMRRGIRAAELPDASIKPPDGFLDLFGRPPRESACECERTTGISLGHALNLVNGPTVAEALKDPRNDIADLIAVEKKGSRIIEELFLSILCRPPTQEELDEIGKSFDAGDIANAEALSSEDAALLASRQADWEKRQHIVTWRPLEVGISKSSGGALLAAQEDGSILASGASPEKDTYTLVAWTELQGITGLRLEVLPDPSLKANGPGRAESGNFVLNELSVVAAYGKAPEMTKPLVLQNPSADFSQDQMPVANAIDGKPETGWAIAPQFGKAHEALFELKEDAGAQGGAVLIFTLEQQFGSMHTIGRLRLSVTTSKRPVRRNTVPDNIARVLLTAPAERSAQQKAELFRYFIGQDPEMADRLRLHAAQDLAWALINSPAFLFNR
jgi:hypothetical protein